MADQRITDLTELTTPADNDVLPIVDVSDTTMASTGTTKKIAMSTMFPSSATDNAIARFDGTTGKKLQSSSIYFSDIGEDVANTINIGSPAIPGAGYNIVLYGGDSTNNVGGHARIQGAHGNGSYAGGDTLVYGGQGGATGEGGDATIQGGNGGATSGKGGDLYLVGGNAQNGDSDGGVIDIRPGNKSGSGANGYIILKSNYSATYGAKLDLDSIASSDKTFTFPNVTGTVVVTSNATGGTGSAGSGKQYVSLVVNGVAYKVLHDGTV